VDACPSDQKYAMNKTLGKIMLEYGGNKDLVLVLKI
jgi:hypothetical protein